MENKKIAKELLKVAKELTAGKDFYHDRLEEALDALQYTPVEHAWSGRKYDEMKKKRKLIVSLIEEMIDEMPIAVDYQVVGIEGGTKTFDSRDELINEMKKHGIKYSGESGERGKKVMWNQPTFSGLLGPMYGGSKTVRYETQEAYDRLST